MKKINLKERSTFVITLMHNPLIYMPNLSSSNGQDGVMWQLKHSQNHDLTEYISCHVTSIGLICLMQFVSYTLDHILLTTSLSDLFTQSSPQSHMKIKPQWATWWNVVHTEASLTSVTKQQQDWFGFSQGIVSWNMKDIVCVSLSHCLLLTVWSVENTSGKPVVIVFIYSYVLT